jgi:hypothetical protein
VIALALSILFAVYLLIPNALFRFILGVFVPLRIFEQRRTEDLTRAVVTLAILYGLALGLVWLVPGFKSHPLGFADSRSLRTSDYEIVASGLYSEAMFKEYGPLFWGALSRTLERQGRLLCWYYILVCIAGFMAGRGCKHYGRLKHIKPFAILADFYLMPHISQWYVILTPFTFPDRRTIVRAEVLMTDGTLYRGDVADHFLNKEGSLSGLFLANPTRFDRRALMKEREAWGSNRAAAKFWRTIPSAKLYLVADKIMNLNLHYESPTLTASSISKYLESLRGELQKKSGAQTISVSITSPRIFIA